MSFVTDASDGNGDTQAKPASEPKNHHNLSIVYIDHDLEKPITESINDEAGKDVSRPNLTVVYIDHHLDGSVDNSHNYDGSNLVVNQAAVIQNQQGMFRLPPELRIVIWELLLPGRRLLGAKAWSGTHRSASLNSGSRRNKECRWFFHVHDWDCLRSWENKSLEVPILLQICAESRSVALQHGQFIFGRRDDQTDTGTWWNSDLDVLVFDLSWNIHHHSWALSGLQGLEHVKHLAIDEEQDIDVVFFAAYDKDYHGPGSLAIDEAIAFSFHFAETDQTKHYIREFFDPYFRDLTVIFSPIFERLYHQSGVQPHFEEYTAIFRVNMSMRAAVKEMRKYGAFIMETHGMPKVADSFSLTYFDRHRGRLRSGLFFAYNDDFDLENIECEAVATPLMMTSLGNDTPF